MLTSSTQTLTDGLHSSSSEGNNSAAWSFHLQKFSTYCQLHYFTVLLRPGSVKVMMSPCIFISISPHSPVSLAAKKFLVLEGFSFEFFEPTARILQQTDLSLPCAALPFLTPVMHAILESPWGTKEHAVPRAVIRSVRRYTRCEAEDMVEIT